MSKDETEWFYVPLAQVAAYAADGWVDTGETVDHHGVHSNMMYRYVDEGADVDNRFPDALRVKTCAASAEGGEVVMTFVTEQGFLALRISPDNLSSHIQRCVRAQSDLIPSSAGRAGVATSPRNDGSDPVAG